MLGMTTLAHGGHVVYGVAFARVGEVTDTDMMVNDVAVELQRGATPLALVPRACHHR